MYQVNDGDKIPAFAQRKKLMDPELSTLMGKVLFKSTKSSRSFLRRDLGELTHIFSHVKHHMGIEHLHFASKPSMLNAVNGDADDADAKKRIRWMNTAEMQQLGITTGVKKILGLVVKAPISSTIAAQQVDEKLAATTASKKPLTKRMKTLTSFFKK